VPETLMVRQLRSAMSVLDTPRRDAEVGQDERAQRLLARLGEPGGLSDIAAELGELGEHQVEYLSAFPPRLIEGIRAVLHDAVMSDEPPVIELQFLPGYEFEVRLLEWGNQLTIHLRGPFASPFPRDSYRAGGKR
jgi:hypothetical protein